MLNEQNVFQTIATKRSVFQTFYFIVNDAAPELVSLT